MNKSGQKTVEKYERISVRIKEPSLLAELRSSFDRNYSITELLDWMHERVEFDKGKIKRHSNPSEILAYGKGRCGEFSILFASLCLAHNYRARIILDMSDHVWNEVWDNTQKRWVHVDPSEKRIDDPFMYEREWKKNLQEVYAFENGKIEDVTQRYKIMKD